MNRFDALWTRTQFLRAAISAGAVGGLVAGGVGGRVAMRLVVTTIAGVVGGLLYRSIRRWIPATHVPKGLVFGLVVMIVPGIIVVNPDNPDFQLFEPVLLFHALFVGIFLLYGLLVVAVAEVLDPAPVRASSPGHPRRAMAREVAVLVVLLGLHVFIAGGMLEMKGPAWPSTGRGGARSAPPAAMPASDGLPYPKRRWHKNRQSWPASSSTTISEINYSRTAALCFITERIIAPCSSN